MDNVIGAEFSACRNYRYALWRIWDISKPKVMFIGLNPSTANDISDDPTIRRVKSMAKNWGFGGVYMADLFAWVTPYPDELLKCPDPVKDNDLWLHKVAAQCQDVVFAWGNFKEAKERAEKVTEMFPCAMALPINKNGSPKHPLYVKSDIKPVTYYNHKQ